MHVEVLIAIKTRMYIAGVVKTGIQNTFKSNVIIINSENMILVTIVGIHFDLSVLLKQSGKRMDGIVDVKILDKLANRHCCENILCENLHVCLVGKKRKMSLKNF